MPPIAAAAAIGAASTFAAGITVTGGVVAFTATTASILASAAISAAVAGIGMALAPKPKGAPGGGVTATIRNPTAYRQIIYGERRLGGVVVFIDTRNKKNGDLDMVVALAGHECDSLRAVDFGDKQVWTAAGGTIGTYANNVDFEFHTGAVGQAASAYLLANNSEWAATKKLAGICYVVVHLKHKADLFPSGIPNMSFTVKGKPLYDPRDFSTGWSDNPALCLRDYFLDADLGFGGAASEIIESEFVALANLCDESVSLAAGGSESRYTCNAVIDSNTMHAGTIDAICASMGARHTYSAGKFRVIAPVYTAPTVALDESHVIGPVSVQTRKSRRDAYNAVRGEFPSRVDNWTETDYPPQISTAYSAADGEPLWRNLALPMTDSASMAQRLAKIELLKSRAQIVAVVPCNLAAMYLMPGATVALSLDHMGWASKPFEVENWVFSIGTDGVLGVNLTLVATDPALFDWTTDDESEFVAGVPTNLPDGFDMLAPGVNVSEEERLTAEDISSVILVAVDSSDAFTAEIEVEHKLAGATAWRATGRASAGIFEIVKALDSQSYDIRARVRSEVGVWSDYTQVSYTVAGSTTPPDDVTGFHCVASGGKTVLTWDPVSDLRLSHYVIRHTPRVAGASWSTSSALVAKIARPASSVTVASRSGTYLIKAADKLGRLSDAAATIVSPVSAVEGMNAAETVDEAAAGFPGIHAGTAVYAAGLALSQTVLFDAHAGLFDSAAGLFDSAGLPYEASGVYDFAAPVDLGALYPVRVYATLQFDSSGGENAFDAQGGLFDAYGGFFDAAGGPEAPGLTAQIQIATTPDDPAGAPAWSAWSPIGAADYDARGFKFRVVLASDDPSATPVVTACAVVLDMPDRVAAGSDLQSGTDAGGLAVVFSAGAFRVAPAVGISGQDLAQGDFFEIVAKSVAGFTVRFKNSGGTVVDRKFDYQARGYGRVI